LPAGTRLTLHFPGGASLVASGPAELSAAPRGEGALLLQSGTVRVDVERVALHPQAGFWLGTPLARLEVVQGARFVVRSFPELVRVSVVSGSVEVLTSASEGKAALVLAPGQHREFRADGSVQVLPGHRTLEDAERAALAGALPRPGVSASPTLMERVEAACLLVGEDRAREQELKSQHRSLREARDPSLMEVQRALAQQAAQSFRDQRLLRVQLSLLEAQSLGASPGSSIGALIDRARALLQGAAPP
jgi:hypothetical protein